MDCSISKPAAPLCLRNAIQHNRGLMPQLALRGASLLLLLFAMFFASTANTSATESTGNGPPAIPTAPNAVDAVDTVDASPKPKRPLVLAVMCLDLHTMYSTTQYLRAKFSENGFGLIEPSCHNVFTRVTGERLPGESNAGRITWGKRLAVYRDVVSDLPDDQIVLYVDAHDYLFFAENAREIANRFQSHNVSVLNACTFSRWPPVPECKVYETMPDRYGSATRCNRPSGGGTIGYAAGLREMYSRKPAFDDNTDDQCWLHGALNQKPYGPAATAAANKPVELQGTWALDITMSIFSELAVSNWFTGGAAGRIQIDGYNKNDNTGPRLEVYPSLVHLTRMTMGRDLKLSTVQQLHDFYKNFSLDHVKLGVGPEKKPAPSKTALPIVPSSIGVCKSWCSAKKGANNKSPGDSSTHCTGGLGSAGCGGCPYCTKGAAKGVDKAVLNKAVKAALAALAAGGEGAPAAFAALTELSAAAGGNPPPAPTAAPTDPVAEAFTAGVAQGFAAGVASVDCK